MKNPDRSFILLPGILACCVAWSAAAAESEATAASGRARIKDEQAQIRSRAATEEAACYQRFAVNDCLQAVRARQRQALGELRREEVALNDAERRNKSAERQRRLEEKEKAREARIAQTPGQAASDAPVAATIGSERGDARKKRRVALKIAPHEPRVPKATKPRRPSSRPDSTGGRIEPAQVQSGSTLQERERARQARALRRDKALANPTKIPAKPLPVPP